MTSSNERYETTAWCSHCRRTGIAVWDCLCTSCVACGKVLGDFSVRKIPSLMDGGLKQKKKRKRSKIKETRKVSTEASSNENPEMSSLSSVVNERLETTAWCSHCKRISNAVGDGLCVSCVACGKVLGDFSVWEFPSLKDRKLKKKSRRTKMSVTRKVSASDEASTNPQMSSVKAKVIHKDYTSDDASDERSTDEDELSQD